MSTLLSKVNKSNSLTEWPWVAGKLQAEWAETWDVLWSGCVVATQSQIHLIMLCLVSLGLGFCKIRFFVADFLLDLTEALERRQEGHCREKGHTVHLLSVPSSMILAMTLNLVVPLVWVSSLNFHVPITKLIIPSQTWQHQPTTQHPSLGVSSKKYSWYYAYTHDMYLRQSSSLFEVSSLSSVGVSRELPNKINFINIYRNRVMGFWY
jgi:hypothetical protein